MEAQTQTQTSSPAGRLKGFRTYRLISRTMSAKNSFTGKYTQTKKKRPIFMVLYLSIQLRCCNKNKTKMLIKCPTHKTMVII